MNKDNSVDDFGEQDSTRTVECHEVSVDELFRETAPTDALFIDPLAECLPLNEIPWPAFEKLCAYVVNENAELNIVQALRYGRGGQKQFSIDIIANREGSKKLVVAQCKRVQKITVANIDEWLSDLRNSARVAQIEEYILCVSASAQADARVMDKWTDMYRKFEALGITLRLWDFDEINQMLRSLPGIVTQFFSRHHADRFCTNAEAGVDSKYPARFKTKFKIRHEHEMTLEDQSVSVNFNLPTERFPHFGAIFNFARSDLSGISFSVSGALLTTWLQWRAWAGDDAVNRPYAQRATWSPGKFVIAAGSVRITLNSIEVEHLDWIFREAWPEFVDSAWKLERKWRFLRFHRIRKSENAFAIVSMKRAHWRTLLEFAQRHDCGDGETRQNIFDAAPGLLKVYVDGDRHGLSGGYHLILKAYSEGGMTLPHEDDVTLGWEPLTDIGEKPIKINPSMAWDAEFTHDWLLDTLKGWVEKWIDKLNDQPLKNTKWPWSQPAYKHHPYELSMTSQARFERRNIDGATNIRELALQVDYYQSHFYAYHSNVDIDPEMTRSVLELVARFIDGATEADIPYICNKLSITADDLASQIYGLIRTSDSKLKYELNTALRCLSKILRNHPTFPQSEIDRAADQLRPIAERVKEDLICQVFSIN